MVAGPRFTHIALPVNDIPASVAWYERFTPLRAIDVRHDPDGNVVEFSHDQGVYALFHERTSDPAVTTEPS